MKVRDGDSLDFPFLSVLAVGIFNSCFTLGIFITSFFGYETELPPLVAFFMLSLSLLLLNSKENRQPSIRARKFALCLSFGSFCLTAFVFLKNREYLFFGPQLLSVGKAHLGAPLLLCISAAVCLSFQWRSACIRVGQILLLVSLVVSFQALTNLFFGINSRIGFSIPSSEASHTIVSALISAFAFLLLKRHEGFMKIFSTETLGGRLGRQWILVAFSIPPIVFWLQLIGREFNLYDKHFGSLIRLLGNMVFFGIFGWRASYRLHLADLNQKQLELERRKVEEENARLLAEHVLEKGKVEFFANVSHEIRTPLTGILGVTELILETKLDTSQQKYIYLLQESANNLKRILDDILDFNKMSLPDWTLELGNTNVYRIVESQYNLFASRAREKNLSLFYEVNPKIPSVVLGDAGRLSQIITNLLNNAIKFTEAGSIHLKVSVVSEVSDSMVLKFSVVDSGIGISDEALPKLFTPFVQVDASFSRKYGGTGLGLYISKQLAEKMGGQVGVVSEPGKGSEFWFTARFGLPSSSIEMLSQPTLSSGKILVAEDNPVNQLLTIAQLKHLGYEAEGVCNGRDVVEVYKGENFKIILMDCQMPEMDGFEATRSIRSLEKVQGRHVPIIALTAHQLPEDEKRCRDAGMDDFLAKPFRRAELAEILRKWDPKDFRL